MERVSTDSRSIDLFGAGKHGARDPGAPGISGTIHDAAWFNALQEELANVVEESGQTVAPGNLRTQLLAALRMNAIHAALNQPGVLVDDSADSVFAANLCNAGVVSPSGGRAYFVGEAKKIGVCSSPYVEMAAIASAFAIKEYHAICHFGANAVCIVGEDEEIVTVGTVTPTSRNTGGTVDLRAVAWSPTLAQLCAVGDGGMIKTAGTGALGTWTNRTAGSSYTGDFRAVAWDSINAQWVIAGEGREIQTSPDGITWTRRNTSPGHDIEALAVGAAGLVAASPTTTALVSADGITWSAAGAGSPGATPGLHYQGGCVFKFDDDALIISPDDGAAWVTRVISTRAVSVAVASPVAAFAVTNSGGASLIYRLGGLNSVTA
jgi:hypothetical protein